MNKRQFLRSVAGTAAGAAMAAAGGFSALAQPSRERIGRVTAWQVGGGTVVEVETDSGLAGHGYTSITDAPLVAAAVREIIAPEIIGQDPMAREAISDQLHRRLVGRGQTGHAVHAISAIDIALWDIAGKLLDEPVWRLLGGARSSVVTYATFGMADMDREQLAQAAREQIAAGQHRLKMVVAADIQGRQRNGETIHDILREDAERIRIVRETAGPEAEIYIDANHGLNEYETRRFIDRIAEYDIAFFEEPLQFNDVRRLADLRRLSPIPIAAGQNEGHLSRFRDLVVEDAVDILQFNVCMCGGFTTALKVAALGQAFGVQIDNGGGHTRFNMHLHAGVANGGMAEWQMRGIARDRVLYQEWIEPVAGILTLPERPGLGFELNRDALREAAA